MAWRSPADCPLRRWVRSAHGQSYGRTDKGAAVGLGWRGTQPVAWRFLVTQCPPQPSLQWKEVLATSWKGLHPDTLFPVVLIPSHPPFPSTLAVEGGAGGHHAADWWQAGCDGGRGSVVRPHQAGRSARGSAAGTRCGGEEGQKADVELTSGRGGRAAGVGAMHCLHHVWWEGCAGLLLAPGEGLGWGREVVVLQKEG